MELSLTTLGKLFISWVANAKVYFFHFFKTAKLKVRYPLLIHSFGVDENSTIETQYSEGRMGEGLLDGHLSCVQQPTLFKRASDCDVGSRHT